MYVLWIDRAHSLTLHPRTYQPQEATGAVAAAAACAAAVARLGLPEGTKPFVPYDDDQDEEEGLWLRLGGEVKAGVG